VSPEGWEGFRKYLGLAVTHLKRTEVLASQDSSWNVLMLDLGRALSWDRAELQGIYDSGVTKNPDNDALHSAMLTALLPKWGGDLNSVDEFVKAAVSRLPKEKGLIIYARLYALVSDIELKSALFTNPRVSWQTMKAGFDEMVARYPHFDNRNMYANFACMARDRETLKEQLALIGNDYVKKFWIASDLLRAVERGSASDDLSGKKSPEARITILQHAANALKSANRPVVTLYLVDLAALNHQ
jgi:hypothetical protein